MYFIPISGGTFRMGTDDEKGFVEDYEGPSTEVTVGDFKIADTTVTNAEFKEFVEETGYISTAEKLGYSFVFHKLLSKKLQEVSPHVQGTPWWHAVKNANWAHPFGPDSDLHGLEEHPVVHVSLRDALAFCDWAGATLPDEAEWEYAARANTNTEYPWGNELTDGNIYHANTWQGDFPKVNEELDGFLGTAPVKQFEPNNWGLYQTIGNVWEWCRNPRYTLLDDFNNDNFSIEVESLTGEYAIRGGSFLCHASYCHRYRVAGRNGVDHMSTSSHLGFRCIKK